MTEIFGILTAPTNVENVVIETLRIWMPDYLAEVERQNELPKRTLGRLIAPETYHGGLDWLSVKEDRLPELVVICNPLGAPERSSNQQYIQGYQVQIGAVLKSEEGTDPEGIVRRNAGLFAAAVMGAIVHHGNLGSEGGLEETVLTGAPKVEFLEVEDRRYAVGITTFEVFVPLVNPSAGPLVPRIPIEEEYPEWPEVTSHKQTVKAEPTAIPLK